MLGGTQPDCHFRSEKNWTVLGTLIREDFVVAPESTERPGAHEAQISLTVWAFRPVAALHTLPGYFCFGPRNVGNLPGKSFKSFSAGRRLMSRHTVGCRVCKVNCPWGGVLAIFGSAERRPEKIVMPQEMERSAGENSGAVGSAGRCALRGDRAQNVMMRGNPIRRVEFMSRSFGFRECHARP